uniref:formyltransferase family protein n=1 Tax=Polynucleobacter sp. TaxID=2029855 RepID=UPI0040470C42
MNRRVIAFVDHEIGYRLLEKIISSQEIFHIQLVAVVTTHDNEMMWWPNVSGLCQKNNIPLHRYREPFNDTFDYANIDWFFMISWKFIIPPSLINQPKLGAINLHYSLLPEYRGVYPVNWAIIEGKKNTGVTYHFVNENVDDGQIICQKEISVSLGDTARSLQLRLDDLAYELFDEMIYWVRHGRLQPDIFKKQTKTKRSYKSYSDFIKSNELDMNREYRAIDLINLLRGKTFMPDSKNLYVIDSATGKRIYINVCMVEGD